MKKNVSVLTALIALGVSSLTAQIWEGNGTGSVYLSTGNVGIGTSNPEYHLDVWGDANVTNNLKIGSTTILGNMEHQFTIGLTPGDGGTTPTVLKIVPSGIANGGPGNPYPDDPGPNLTCLNGVVIPNILATKDVFSVYKTNNLNQNIGNMNMGHTGAKAFIETEGTGTGGANHPGDLFINEFCQRNVHIFNANTGVPFGGNGTTKIMSVEGRLNVSSSMQLGCLSCTNFQMNDNQLYVYTPPTVPVGIRVRHGGSGQYGVKVVELSDNDKGLGVFRGTPLVDGNERFSVRGDGLTAITSTNTNALQINDANNSNMLSFNFSQSGGTNRMWAVNSLFAYGIGIDNAGDGHIVGNINAPANVINFKLNAGVPQVWIGNQKEATGPHTDFRLAVDGKLVAKSCYVTLNDWADFVFEPNYELPKLSEVESFYKENKHLPNIPSEQEIKDNGVDVAEMNKLLLMKVEELTMYIVEQQKEIDALKEKMK